MTVSSGVYGLAGVLIGSGITATAQWSLASRTDRLDTRLARRQVLTELQRLRSILIVFLSSPGGFEDDVATGEGRLATGEGRLATGKWEAHSDRLARHLSDGDWQAVAAAYLEIGVVADQSDRVARARGTRLEFALAELRENAKHAAFLIDEAVKCLR